MTSAGKIFKFFERDHREIDSLFLESRFKPLAERLALFEEYDRRLERHIVWEETILFPALTRENPQFEFGPIQVMLMEHKEIRKNRAEVLKALREGNLEAAQAHEKSLSSSLSHHNLKEERVIYPACDQLFSDEDASLILSKIQNGA